MRILMFGWEYPPYNSGGLGVACMGLSAALASEVSELRFVLPQSFPISSEQVSFIFADQYPPQSTMFEAQSINWEITSGYSQPQSHNLQVFRRGKVELDFRHYGKDLVSAVKLYAARAAAIAAEQDFDIIHAHDWLTYGAGLITKEISGKPLVVHIHATEYDRSGENPNPLVTELERQGLQGADCVMAVSQLTKNVIVEKYGIDPDKVEVVHNGINLELETRFAEVSSPVKEIIYEEEKQAKSLWALKRQGYKLVLYLGRLTMQKGVEYLLRATKELVADGEKVALLIAGKGDMETRLIEEAAALGIADKVFFIGFLRGEKLDKIYHAADLFVMPSVSEPFGLVALEALAYKTPIIISKQSGVGEVLANVVQVDFWDTSKLAREIRGVLHDDELQQRLVQAARKSAQSLTWGKAARKVAQIYKRLTGS